MAIHYRDNATTRTASEFYYRDGSTTRTVVEGWVNDSGTWRQFWSTSSGPAPAVAWNPEPDGQYEFNAPSGEVAVVAFDFNPDGTWQLATATSTVIASGRWKTDTNSITNAYEISITGNVTNGNGSTSGVPASTPLNGTYTPLNQLRGFGFDLLTSGSSVGVYTVTIREIANTSNTTTTATFTVRLQVS